MVLSYKLLHRTRIGHSWKRKGLKERGFGDMMELNRCFFPFSSHHRTLTHEAEMDGSEGPLRYAPFRSLGDLLRGKIPARSPAGITPDQAKTQPDSFVACGPTGDVSLTEKELFQEAMKGVRPLKKDHLHLPSPYRGVSAAPGLPPAEEDIRPYLDALVREGKGFILDQTPEYVEGTGKDIPREFAQRLHRGDFSIQAYLDLHGLGVVQARQAFEDFLKQCLVGGKGAVLIIHGRGISSPKEPVLKNKVREWLTRTRWRKWVIAFASARSFDGGTGATYVLLRPRFPLKPKRPA